MPKFNYNCPNCGTNIFHIDNHICPVDMDDTFLDTAPIPTSNAIQITPLTTRKEITMSHNTVKFKDMRSVDKAMLLLAKHEGEEIMVTDNQGNENTLRASKEWVDEYIYYVVPKAKVKPEPEYKTMFVDKQGKPSAGNPLRKEGTWYIEIQALEDALTLRHTPKDESTKTLDILMSYVK